MTPSHDHSPISFGKAFAIGITLNVAFVLIEAFYGWKSVNRTGFLGDPLV
tara:strand:+ start:6233 stop:6382 length:150 start_codon:yes stop_codon:yes gene_type:complete